jgi:uncharacterized protein DUF4440
MTATAAAMDSIATWEQDIRALEEAGRVAFLAADTPALDALWDEELLVNSPLNTINDKSLVLKLLGTGRIRHTFDDVVIERVHRYGDVVVVMGRDTVDGPPHGAIVDRRFTNVWQLQAGTWRMIARHAQIVAPRPAQ